MHIPNKPNYDKDDSKYSWSTFEKKNIFDCYTAVICVQSLVGEKKTIINTTINLASILVVGTIHGKINKWK